MGADLLVSLLNADYPLSLSFLIVVLDGRVCVAINPIKVLLWGGILAPGHDSILSGEGL